MQLDAVAAAGLGAVERLVGELEQLAGCATLVGKRGHAGADGDHAARGMGQGQRLDRGPQPLGGERGGLDRLLGQQHQEFLAAVAVEGVAGADLLIERAGDRAQDVVTGQMAGRVVVGLEEVDVEQRDRVDVAVAIDPAAQDIEVLGEPVAVAEAGQRVVPGVVVQLAVQRRTAALTSRRVPASSSAMRMFMAASRSSRTPRGR